MKYVFIAGVTVTLLLTGCEKARLDEEVRRLCEKDGGIKVYETVALPPHKFDQFGEVLVAEKSLAEPRDEFFYVWDVLDIKGGNPSLRRHHFKLYRKVDGKLIGEGVSYARRGGDMPGPWHDSSFGCPEDSSIKDVTAKVFAKSKQAEVSK